VKTNKGLVGIIVILVIALVVIVAWKSSSPSSNAGSPPTTNPSLSNAPPSNQIIEAAVYNFVIQITNYPWNSSPKYGWLEKVEVIRIGIPYTVNFPYTRKIWPIDVYLVGNQHKEEAKGIIYQDEFGDWKANIVP
jgi:hypothetical protein